MHPGSHLNQPGSGRLASGLAYSLSATLAAAAAGTFLGTLGGFVPVDGRIAAATVFAVLAIVVGAMELGFHRLPVVQRDRETSQRWRRTHPLRWAMRNGAALGIGATSRIGFWLWYLIPVSALLLGSPVLSGMIYGTYRFNRGWSVWLLLLGLLDRVPGGDPGDWLIANYGTARRLTAGGLLVVGVAVGVAVGV